MVLVVVAVKLTAMMVVRNEVGRYLFPCIHHLLGFCDEVRILDDSSDEGWVFDDDRVFVKWQSGSTFYEHEGNTRQALLEWAMEGQPTHLLAIDADEFVADGSLLRAQMEGGSQNGVWKLTMTEVWAADPDWLHVRMDGAWSPRPVGIAFEVPPMLAHDRQARRHWRMPDRALACGRTPVLVTMAGNRTTTEAVTEILHFGWANAAEREARYQRYVTHDGGVYHANTHLESIMWDDERVQTMLLRWPKTLLDKEFILGRANR